MEFVSGLHASGHDALYSIVDGATRFFASMTWSVVSAMAMAVVPIVVRAACLGLAVGSAVGSFHNAVAKIRLSREIRSNSNLIGDADEEAAAASHALLNVSAWLVCVAGCLEFIPFSYTTGFLLVYFGIQGVALPPTYVVEVDRVVASYFYRPLVVVWNAVPASMIVSGIASFSNTAWFRLVWLAPCTFVVAVAYTLVAHRIVETWRLREEATKAKEDEAKRAAKRASDECARKIAQLEEALKAQDDWTAEKAARQRQSDGHRAFPQGRRELEDCLGIGPSIAQATAATGASSALVSLTKPAAPTSGPIKTTKAQRRRAARARAAARDGKGVY